MNTSIEERSVGLTQEDEFKLVEVEMKEEKRSFGEIDGKVPWNTAILPILRGHQVTVYKVYSSIQLAYGDESISRMRTYKWLNQLVTKNIAYKVPKGAIDEYYIKTVEEEAIV